MKKVLFLLAALTAALVIKAQDSITPVMVGSYEAPSAKVDLEPELAQVTADLKKKFDAHTTTEADLAENLQAVNGLIAKHLTDGNREQLARLYLLDAHIYADGITNLAKARAVWGQVTRDFPGTLAARGAALSLAKLNAQAATEPDPAVPEGLDVGQKFPGFNEMDANGNQLATAAYRGTVTMIDFWATWCPPCRAEMPNVVNTYYLYHAQGFNIIGISLDSDRNALATFTQAHDMPWAQYFDGLGWNNKLAKKYQVQSIPMSYLLDRHGIILGKELRGRELVQAVGKAVAAN